MCRAMCTIVQPQKWGHSKPYANIDCVPGLCLKIWLLQSTYLYWVSSSFYSLFVFLFGERTLYIFKYGLFILYLGNYYCLVGVWFWKFINRILNTKIWLSWVFPWSLIGGGIKFALNLIQAFIIIGQLSIKPNVAIPKFNNLMCAAWTIMVKIRGSSEWTWMKKKMFKGGNSRCATVIYVEYLLRVQVHWSTFMLWTFRAWAKRMTYDAFHSQRFPNDYSKMKNRNENTTKMWWILWQKTNDMNILLTRVEKPKIIHF